ncbi:MAG: hypothetical protein R3E10_04435 [Gemmatimonadota bacterium]
MPRTLLAVTLLLSACSFGGPADVEVDPAVEAVRDEAGAWVGDYFGSGAGLVDGQPFENKDARLRIAFDADSVRLPTCPSCVTITLDAVFALVNVRVADPVELTLAYDRGAVRHTLVVRRFSGGGEVGNVVLARATIGTIGVSTPFFDVSYLLERP